MSHLPQITLADIRRALSLYQPRLGGASPAERSAAVAVVLRQRSATAEVLLIRRALREGDPWSGHMALPGGRREPFDADERGTAIRETFEEVCLDLGAQAELLGRLDDVPAVARGRPVGMIIAVFVFELLRDEPLVFSEEVVEAFWVPLADLAGGQLDTTTEYELDGRTITLPGWTVEGRVVWGLTHRILGALLSTLDSSRPQG